ncbi:MAG: hypothetical protein DWI21_11975 [Planctomycetota bacterium]|nr:MAG: hypothetical protein DWI21_11975 [Planctomycetota bacterium]
MEAFPSLETRFVLEVGPLQADSPAGRAVRLWRTILRGGRLVADVSEMRQHGLSLTNPQRQRGRTSRNAELGAIEAFALAGAAG